MKTIHPIPPAGSEEALIRALETLLAQENPDEARLQALLDQLDRQTGAAPLDPEAGWADLQHRRSTRPKRRGRRAGVLGGVWDRAGGKLWPPRKIG